MTLGGPRYCGELKTGGFASFVDGGLSILFNGLLCLGTVGSETLVETRISIPNPGPGTRQVSSASANVLDDSTGGPEPWAHVLTTPFRLVDPYCPSDTNGPDEHAVSRSGTITITDYRPPTQNAFGWIYADVALSLEYVDVSPAGQTLTLRTRVRLPIAPLGGLPSAARSAALRCRGSGVEGSRLP